MSDTEARGRGARKSAAAYRTISEVSEALDVPQHVLRFWETKFTQVRPLKRGGGRRYYRPEDIQLLQKIQKLLYEDGYTIKGVQRLLREGKVEDDRETAVETAADLFGEGGRPAGEEGDHGEADIDAAAGAAAPAASRPSPEPAPGASFRASPGPVGATGAPSDAGSSEPGQTSGLAPGIRAELQDLLTELKALRAELRGD